MYSSWFEIKYLQQQQQAVREALWLSVHKLGMGQTPIKYSKMDGKCGWK